MIKNSWKKWISIGVTAVSLAAVTPLCSMAAGTVVVGGGTGAASSSYGPGAGSGIDAGEDITEADTGLLDISGRTDYFTAPVTNPVVHVVEKYTYDQMVQDLNNLKRTYGDKMQINIYGTSLDGRSLYEVVLGNASASKHIMIQAGIHAREYMTPLLVMKQLEYGLAFYDTGNYDGIPLSTLLSQVAVHFVPMTNPDGICISQGGESTIRSLTLRQTIARCYANDVAQGRTSRTYEDYLTVWKANARGVDLNQNFPADWDQVVSCSDPSYATYRGTSALSEPESQALAQLAESRNWALTISYHSMGNLIYWDYEGNKVTQASGELATIIQQNTGYNFGGSSGHGGFKDWTQIKDSPIPGVTIEVGSVACPLPISQYADIWNRNKMVWALAAEYAMTH
ncbi:MAG: peptidase [Clostridiales bacterium]|nr:peptidase [Clostridiales bacterium]